MDDFIDDVPLEETYAESQQRAVKRFCDELNPRNVKDKPFVALCSEFKKFGIEASSIAEGLQDNIYLPFLNMRYVVLAKIFEDSTDSMQKFVKMHKLDIADFIRYTVINKNYL